MQICNSGLNRCGLSCKIVCSGGAKQNAWASPLAMTPTRQLLATIVVTVGTVKFAGVHTALLETGVPSRMDTDHCDQASRAVQLHRRERFGRHVSRELRCGNPRRRFDMDSKGVLVFSGVFAGHLSLRLRETEMYGGSSRFAGCNVLSHQKTRVPFE